MFSELAESPRITSLPEGMFDAVEDTIFSVSLSDAFPSPCPAGQLDKAAPVSGEHYCERDQETGLIELYQSLSGDAWTSGEGWNSTEHPCTGNGGGPWFGLRCGVGDKSDRVVEVSLANNNLFGVLPAAALASVSELTFIDLSGNSGISGSLEGIEGAVQLEGLWCTSCALEGPLSPLSGLTGLRSLRLEQNNLADSSLGAVSGLTLLEELRLNNNKLDGSTLEPLSSLSSLSELQLSSCGLTGSVRFVGGLQSLHSLVLSGNRLTGTLQDLAQLQDITTLDIRSNELNGPIDAIAELPIIHAVHLSNNEFTGNIDVIGQLQSQSVRRLSLADNQLSGRLAPELVRGRFPELILLDISGNDLRGELVPFLDALQEHHDPAFPLKSLAMQDCELSGLLPKELPDEVELFSVSGNWLSGAVPGALEAHCNVTACELDQPQQSIHDNDLLGLVELNASMATGWVRHVAVESDPCIDLWPGVICDWQGGVRYLRLGAYVDSSEDFVLPASILNLETISVIDIPGARWQNDLLTADPPPPTHSSARLVETRLVMPDEHDGGFFRGVESWLRWWPVYRSQAEREHAAENEVVVGAEVYAELVAGSSQLQFNISDAVEGADLFVELWGRPVATNEFLEASPGLPDLRVASFRIDRVAPVVVFDLAPPAIAASRDVDVRLGASETDCSFDYGLLHADAASSDADAVTWIPVASSGGDDAEAADADVLPFSGLTALERAPARVARDVNATFIMVEAAEAGYWEFKLDGNAWVAIVPIGSRSLDLDGLSVGLHEITIRAVQAETSVGDAQPVGFSWRIDPAWDVPELTVELDEAPAEVTSAATATFVVTSNHASAWMECKLDGGLWTPCLRRFSVGPVEPGDHVLEVRAQSELSLGVTATTSHGWTFLPGDSGAVISVAEDGAYALFARATDPAGNTGLLENPALFRVDTVHPSTSAVLRVPDAWKINATHHVSPTPAQLSDQLASVAGLQIGIALSATDGLDHLPCRTCTFQCAAWLQEDSTNVVGCDVVEGAQGNASSVHLPAAGSDGRWHVELSAVDEAGNVDATPSGLEFYVDRAAPTVDARLLGGVAAEDGSVLVAVSRVDVAMFCNDGEAAAGCLFLVSLHGSAGAPHAVEFADRTGEGRLEANATLNLPVDDDYELYVQAVDSVGNAAEPMVLHLRRDTTPPASPLLYGDAEGTALAAIEFLRLGSFELWAVASDPDAVALRVCADVEPTPDAAAIEAPTQLLDGVALCGAEPTPTVGGELSVGQDGSAQIALEGLAHGVWRVSMWGVDLVGNSDNSTAATAWLVVDGEPPVLAILGDSPFPIVAAGQAFEFAGVVSKAYCSVALFVDVPDACAANGLAPTWSAELGLQTSYQLSVSTQSLAAGSHFVTLCAVDRAGNTAETPLELTWWVDATPPEVELLTNVPQFTNDPDVSVEFTCRDRGLASVAPQADCAVELVLLTAQLLLESSTATDATVVATAEGVHGVDLVPQDAAGNRGDAVRFVWAFDVTPPLLIAAVSLYDGTDSHLIWCFQCLSNSGSSYDDDWYDTVGALDWPIVRSTTEYFLTAVCHDMMSDCVIYSRTTYTALVAQCGDDGGTGSDVEVNPWVDVDGTVWVAGLSDGQYRVDVKTVDTAGNVFNQSSYVVFWVDTAAPSEPLLELTEELEQKRASGDPFLATASTAWPIQRLSARDESPPGSKTIVRYTVDRGEVEEWLSVDQAIELSTPFNLDRQFTSGDHQITVWLVDEAMNAGTPTILRWNVAGEAPQAVVSFAPAAMVGTAAVAIIVEAEGNGTYFEGKLDQDGEWSPLCRPGVESQRFGAVRVDMLDAVQCRVFVSVIPREFATYSFYVRSVSSVGIASTEPVVTTWNYGGCAASEYMEIDRATSARICLPCPEGADCSDPLVTADQLLPKAGYWRKSDAFEFYDCPIDEACVRERVNGTEVPCATGYDPHGLLCGICAPDFYLQWGSCVPCPATGTDHVWSIIGIVFAALIVLGLLFRVRSSLPMGPLSVTLSFAQIISSSNSSYTIRWPEAFHVVTAYMKAAALDVLTVFKADCTGRLSYYERMDLTLALFFVAVVVVFIVQTAMRLALEQKRRAKSGKGRLSIVEALRKLNYSRPLKPVTYMFIIAYPTVSATMMKLFVCLEVGGKYYLQADLLVECTGDQYASHVAVAAIFIALYTFGFPVALTAFIYKRRQLLDDPVVKVDWGWVYHT